VQAAPDPAHIVVRARHRIFDPLQLLPVVLAHQLDPAEDLPLLQVAHAELLRPAVDVVPADQGVVVRPRGHGDFDVRVPLGEGRERVADEDVHAAGRAGPVAVVEVEALALDDEGADAILREVKSARAYKLRVAYLALRESLQGSNNHCLMRPCRDGG
jgi:hypothetical protein